jgi:hypothetical protein
LREVFRRDPLSVLPLFVIGDKIDFSSQFEESEPHSDKTFLNWLRRNAEEAYLNHSRESPSVKLWHLNGGLESFSKVLNLITFYELDSPTKHEIEIAKSVDKLMVTNSFCKEVFENLNVKSEVIPLAFDNYNFKKIEKEHFNDGRITFNLCGKFEHRKHHKKIINAWVKKYGNDKRYSLQCAVFNPFLNENLNKQLFSESLNGCSYFNVNFLGHMIQNALYNDFLNSGDIILGMSGGEGWGLPEFQSVGIGKHSVILNATGYKEWANNENSVLVETSGKIDAYDGLFFKKGGPFNQGQIFNFKEDDFIDGCEKAIKRVEKDRVNHEGLKVQENFSASRMTDAILSVLS